MDVHGLAALFLPEPERAPLLRRTRMDVPRASYVLGLIEFFAAGLYLVHDYMRFAVAFVQQQTAAVVQSAPQTFDTFGGRLAFNWSGSIAWVAWLFRPTVWLLVGVVAVGGVRMVAFLVDREVVAEPWVWAPLRLVQALRRVVVRQARRLAFGPLRPDRRIEKPGGGELVILTCRERPGWNELITIEVDERFYRLVGVEERRDGPYRCYAYRLRERPDDAEVFRGLVRYEPVAVPGRPDTA